MRYHNITKDDMLNGCGLRVVLWVSGCTHQCPGCHNPITWDLCGGLPFDQEAREELFDALSKDHISGLTLSGGDPLHPANREEIKELIYEVKERFPTKNIWLYTGFRWEQIRELSFLSMVDVIVDGRFIEAAKDPLLHWRGSSNQRIIDVRQTLQNNSGYIVLFEEETADDSDTQIKLHKTSNVWIPLDEINAC